MSLETAAVQDISHLATESDDSGLEAADNDQAAEPDDQGMETANDDWDREFTALVAENADVIVESPRLPGVKLPFGAAMLMCQGKLTPQNVNRFYAEGLQLLANRVTETEEEEEAPEDETEEPDRANDDKDETVRKSEDQEKQKNNDRTAQPKTKADTLKNPGPRITGSKKVSSKTVSSAAAEDEVVNIHTDAKNMVTKQGAKVSRTVPSKNYSETAGSGIHEAVLMPDDKNFSIDPETVTIERDPLPETHKAYIAELPSGEAWLTSSSSEIIIAPEAEYPADVILDDSPESNYGASIEAEGEPVSEVPVYQPQPGEFMSFIEGEEVQLLNRFEEIDLKPYELQETNDELFEYEPVYSPPAGVADMEHSASIEVPIEEFESSLSQLSEQIKTSDPETAQRVNQISDKIIEVSASIEAGGQDFASEDEAQAELEELFTELFAELGIDCTADLTGSLAHLALEYNLAAKIQGLKSEDKADNTPKDKGTHEIINHLLAAISHIKRTARHAYLIGKSTLMLYSRKLKLDLAYTIPSDFARS